MFRAHLRGVAGALVLALVAGVPCLANSLHPTPLHLTNLDGHSTSLSDLRGHVVVLNFWATWCAPCVEEMPRLVALQGEWREQGVRVVGASADEQGARDLVRDRARELGLNFDVWIGATTADMERFGLPGTLPGTVVLDRRGVVRARHAGVVDAAWLREHVRAALDDPPTPGDLPEEASAEDHSDEEAVETAASRPPDREAATVPS